MINKPPKRSKSKFFSAFLLLLSLSVIVPPTRPAYACSCARSSAPNQALADATVVFSGQVTNIERVKGRLNVTLIYWRQGKHFRSFNHSQDYRLNQPEVLEPVLPIQQIATALPKHSSLQYFVALRGSV